MKAPRLRNVARVARLPELYAQPDGLAALGAGDERIDHKVCERLDQRAERQGDDQPNRYDDYVAPQEKVLESLDH